MENSGNILNLDDVLNVETFIRYRNRKIYSPKRRKYVRYEKIFEEIKEGKKIRILEHKTNRDITGVSLAREAIKHSILKENINPTIDQVNQLLNLIRSWKSNNN